MNFNHECRLNAKIIFPFLLYDLKLHTRILAKLIRMNGISELAEDNGVSI
jgi:hypothetical protein